MKYQITAQTRLEPGITQALLPELAELDRQLEYIETKESECEELGQQKEYFEYKMTSGWIGDTVPGYFGGGLLGASVGGAPSAITGSTDIMMICLIAGAIIFGIFIRKNRKKKYGKKAAQQQELMDRMAAE